jgi:hypothetical protein
MKRLGLSLIYAIGGYLIAALVGYFLIGQFSSNTHDRAVEAAMTSAFVLGPLGGVAGFIVGFIRSGRRAGRASTET